MSYVFKDGHNYPVSEVLEKRIIQAIQEGTLHTDRDLIREIKVLTSYSLQKGYLYLTGVGKITYDLKFTSQENLRK